MSNFIPSMLTFTPAIRTYVWGGQTLLSFAGPDVVQDGTPIAEVWAIYEENPVTSGIFAGRALAELVREYPNEILGKVVVSRGIQRFPLLIKLLDCASWLSLQVHPNDEQAVELEGPTFMGKTEAWHILEAAPLAQLIAGIKQGTSLENLHAAIGNEKILDLVEYHNVEADDTIFMPAGTIHALGPGLLVYEVQQTSDLTYRVFDWNRPLTNGRALHIEKSISVTDPFSQGRITRQPGAGNSSIELVYCPYFLLEKLSNSQERDTRGESFHALTVIDGGGYISTLDQKIPLHKFETILVPAVCGTYRLDGDFQILCASIAR